MLYLLCAEKASVVTKDKKSLVVSGANFNGATLTGMTIEKNDE